MISILVGTIIFVGGCFWLWYMLARPIQWVKFTEMDHDFWVRRGVPIKWAGACKKFEQGRGLKVLVAVCIFFSLILVVAAVILPTIFPHKG